MPDHIADASKKVMTNRELDALVAEKVMGWTDIAIDQVRGPRIGETTPILCHGAWREMVPYFLTDPTADYEVLKHVRETWDEHDTVMFDMRLRMIWEGRCGKPGGLDRHPYPYLYEPGDYSLAALAALGVSIPTPPRPEATP